jgi:hypothetical protein
MLLLNAITKPFNTLLNIYFKDNRKANLYNLQITPQVCYLTKALNDRFDSFLRRIYITDGEALPNTFIFLPGENQPKYIYLQSENEAIIPIFLQNESGGYVGGVSFIINVPAAIAPTEIEINEILSFANEYKLAGKTCKVINN